MILSEKRGAILSPGAKIAAFVLAAMFMVSPTIYAADKPEIFRIATASKKGTFYPIGTLIAKGVSGLGC